MNPSRAPKVPPARVAPATQGTLRRTWAASRTSTSTPKPRWNAAARSIAASFAGLSVRKR